jgi:hypothetical protein
LLRGGRVRVELRALVVAQHEIERRTIVAHVFDPRRLRNRDHLRLREHPCKRDAHDRHAALPRDLVERRMLRQPSVIDRAVRHRRYPALAQPRQQIEPDRGAPVVQDLVGRAGAPPASSTSSAMSDVSKLLTPQWRIFPARRSASKPSTVSSSGTEPRQCSRYRSMRSVCKRFRLASHAATTPRRLA